MTANSTTTAVNVAHNNYCDGDSSKPFLVLAEPRFTHMNPIYDSNIKTPIKPYSDCYGIRLATGSPKA